jgi:hypothetical protein
MKTLGYVIHILALILVGLGAAISWELFVPLGIFVEIIYWGLFLFLFERIKDDGM